MSLDDLPAKAPQPAEAVVRRIDRAPPQVVKITNTVTRYVPAFFAFTAGADFRPRGFFAFLDRALGGCWCHTRAVTRISLLIVSVEGSVGDGGRSARASCVLSAAI